MIGAIVIFVISAYVILYVIALEPLIGRYKRLKRIQGFKQWAVDSVCSIRPIVEISLKKSDNVAIIRLLWK